MLFTSYSFIAFIAILFILYYIVPKKFQWKLLLIASYIFYSFAGFKYLFYILVTTISTYYVSLKIENLHLEQSTYLKEKRDNHSREEKRSYKENNKSKRWRLLLGCLVFNFGILVVLKYTNFTIANINELLNLTSIQTEIPFVDLLLPLGISFYTFQTMGYIIDIYRGKYQAEKNIGKLALFISFFPQLIQGPISRFDDLSKTMFEEHSFSFKNFEFGIQRILWGYFKKLVIADRILVAVNTIIQSPEIYNGAYVFIGMIFYAVQLYADFTGGIDITLGIAEVLGIKLKENFNRPYFSKNIAEYWRRWHISLGSWFKEYLFYPISVNKRMLKLSKRARKVLGKNIGRKLPVYIASIIVWSITGIWHGASWNFIVWGLLNCFFIILSEECKPLYEGFHKKFNLLNTTGYKIFMISRTFLLMCSIRILDCYRDVSTSIEMYGSMFTVNNFNVLYDGSLLKIGLAIEDYIILILAVTLVFTVSILQRKGEVRMAIRNNKLVVRQGLIYALLILILVFGVYGIGFDSNQFIYNQF